MPYYIASSLLWRLLQIELQPGVESTRHRLSGDIFREVAQEDMLEDAWLAISPLKPQLEQHFLPQHMSSYRLHFKTGLEVEIPAVSCTFR